METRHAARLMYRDGHSCNAIAKEFGIALGTVKSWKRRAGKFEPVWRREDKRERLALEALRSSPLWQYVKDSPRQVQLAAAALCAVHDREAWRMLVGAMIAVLEPTNPAVKSRKDTIDRLKQHPREWALVAEHSEAAQLAAYSVVRAGPGSVMALRGVADLVARG